MTSSRSPAGCCRRPDRLHAARVHPDLPPRRPARSHEGRTALHARLAAPLQRVLPGAGRPSTSSCASGLIKSHLSHVDVFLAPSKFLLERYVEWGIPREKIRFEDYGRLPETPVARDRGRSPVATGSASSARSALQGLDVLLDAMRILRDDRAGRAAASWREPRVLHEAIPQRPSCCSRRPRRTPLPRALRPRGGSDA